MRRYAHLAILPAMFLTFTEVEYKTPSNHPVTVDVEGASIRPIASGERDYYPAAASRIRTLEGVTHYVTTPIEEIQKAVGARDLRPATETKR